MDKNLKFLTSLNEDELCELVVLPLLEALDYKEIRYLHGSLELGKDIVCRKNHAIDGNVYTGFVVKSIKVDGTVTSSRSLRGIHFQIKQSLTSPFLDPFDGKEIHLDKVYFLTSHPISQSAILSLKHELDNREKDVSFIDGRKLLTLIQTNLPDLLVSIPNSENRYMRMLFQKFSKNLAITRLGSKKDLKLEDIYIPTQLTEISPHVAQYITLAGPEVMDGEDFEDVFHSDKFLVVLADAGAGKSTLMHNALVKFSSQYEVDKGGALIPIFIELYKVPFKKIASLADFKSWINAYVSEVFNFDGLDWEKTDSYVLLLDGFDEIKSHHGDLLDYLIDLKSLFRSGVILTSRPSRIPDLKGEFKYFKLNPFQNSDILQFLSFWFEDGSRTNELYEFIISDSVLLSFCRTPLILTLFTILGSREKSVNLPSRRTDIYESIVELLIDKWDSIREIKSEVNPQTKHFILEKLAFSNHSNGLKLFSKRIIHGIATKHFSDDETFHRKLVEELIYRSSLIRKTSETSFQFVHLSFQEFFTARHLVRFRNERKINSVLVSQWWVNTLKFYFGLLKSLDSQRISEKKTKHSSHVLIEYLAEAPFTSKSKREEILDQFGKQILLFGYQDKASMKVFVENCEIIIPGLIQILKTRQDMKLNYTYFKLIRLLGQDGVRYIDLEKYPIDVQYLPEVQDFVFPFIKSKDDSQFNVYMNAFKFIEDQFTGKEGSAIVKFVKSNSKNQKNHIRDSKFDRKTKKLLNKIIEYHDEKLKGIIKGLRW